MLVMKCFCIYMSNQVQTIMAIVDYVKKNPRASQDEMAKEIEKHVQLFVEKIDSL